MDAAWFEQEYMCEIRLLGSETTLFAREVVDAALDVSRDGAKMRPPVNAPRRICTIWDWIWGRDERPSAWPSVERIE